MSGNFFIFAEYYEPGELTPFYLAFGAIGLGALLVLVNIILAAFQKGRTSKLIHFGLILLYGSVFFRFWLLFLIGWQLPDQSTLASKVFFTLLFFVAPIMALVHFIFLVLLLKKQLSKISESNPTAAAITS